MAYEVKWNGNRVAEDAAKLAVLVVTVVAFVVIAAFLMKGAR
jgi:hypothetical protein